MRFLANRLPSADCLNAAKADGTLVPPQIPGVAKVPFFIVSNGAFPRLGSETVNRRIRRIRKPLEAGGLLAPIRSCGRWSRAPLRCLHNYYYRFAPHVSYANVSDNNELCKIFAVAYGSNGSISYRSNRLYPSVKGKVNASRPWQDGFFCLCLAI